MWGSRFFILSFLLFNALFLGAQNWDWSVGSSLGSIWKHSDKISFDTDVVCYSLSLGVLKVPSSDQDWTMHYKNLRHGWLAKYQYLGDENLGHAISVMPHLEKDLIRLNRVKTQLGLAAGLAYLTEVFDPEKNRVNNAIGSHLNMSIQFDLDARIALTKQLALFFGAELSHYSNGAYALPNLGINVFAARIGLRSQLNSVNDFERPAKISRFRMQSSFRAGLAEFGVSKGPKYQVFNLGLGLKWIKNQNVHWSLGLEYEMNYALYWYGINTGVFEDSDQAYQGTYRFIAVLSREQVFGNWSILTQTGINVKKTDIAPPKTLVNVLGIRRYFKLGKSISPHIGIYMKSHGTVAESVSVGMGFDIF